MDRSLLRHAYALTEALDEMIEPAIVAAGLTNAQFELLAVLDGESRAMTQVEVCKQVGLSPSTVSELLLACRRKGLIDRVGRSLDKRIRETRLTVEGSKRLRRVQDRVRQIEALLEQSLGRDSTRQCIDALADAIEKVRDLERRV